MQDANYAVVALNYVDNGSLYANVDQPSQRTAGQFRLNTNSNVGISAVVFR
jgi:hypothetical protein